MTAETKKIERWRLILGPSSQETMQSFNGGTLQLSEEQLLMDEALGAIYDNTSEGGGGSGSGSGLAGGAGLGPSSPKITKWLGDIRSLFDKEIVTVIQNDAMERKGLKQLMFEPEVLEQLEPNINLASTMLILKDQIPKRSKESVRIFISKIVEEINKRLADDIKRAVTAAINKRAHSPIPSAASMDFKMTIERNLKNYNPTIKTIVPEHFYFFDHMKKNCKWTVILDIDQSGSMGESVIYSSIISCILASMNSLKTRIVAFDTNIVDLTEKSDDPVDLLFGFQLGGGTDIEKSVKYCQQFIETPSKTLFFLISDLEEGGNRSGLLHRLEDMKASGVTVVCLLAIADGGKPYYDEQMARNIARMGIACFACTPEKLPEILEAALKGGSLEHVMDRKSV